MKIILVGSSGVGKSTFLHQYIHKKFEFNLGATIGVDFVTKTVELTDGSRLSINVWDTAGQERYRTITPTYFKRAAAAIFMYSVIDRESFNDINNWLIDYDTHASIRNAVLVLVGNKVDLEAKRVVGWLEGNKFARQNGMLFFESSARDNVSCGSVFDAMIECAAQKPHLNDLMDFIDKVSERYRDPGIHKLTQSNLSAGKDRCGRNCSAI